jgi:hypothetical protein
VSVAAARGMRIARMPAGTGIARLADVPYCQRRDGFSQLVIRGKDPVVAKSLFCACRRGQGQKSC